MSEANKSALRYVTPVLSVTPRPFVEAILSINDRLGDGIKWIIEGDLAESLRTVNIEPECLEIVTSKEDAIKIFQAFQHLNPMQITLQIQRLPRNAKLGQNEYPIYIRNYYFDFESNGVLVKVRGDLQYKVGDWDWGDILDFAPEYVYVVGKKIAVVPLSIAYQLYQFIGWTDRAEKISRVVQRRMHARKVGP